MLITDYFARLLRRIAQSPVVGANNVSLEARSPYTGIIRGDIFFLDGSVLYFTEVVDVEIVIERVKYRYQYQQFESSERIFRYDNAKHHPALPTFPHHKHLGRETEPDNVLAVSERFFEDIFEEIEECVSRLNRR